MKRPIKAAIITAVVALALGAGWLLTRPSDPQPSASATPVPTVAPDVLPMSAPNAAAMADVIPADVTWVLSNMIAVPVSRTAGPTRTSAEGIRSGFTHDPPGALMAAVNWSAAAAQVPTHPALGVPLVAQRMVPWTGQSKALADAERMAQHPGSVTQLPWQIGGFRYLAYDGNHATLAVAKYVPAGNARIGYAEYLTLVWSSGDWMIVPAIDGHSQIGAAAPFPLSDDWTRFAGVA